MMKLRFSPKTSLHACTQIKRPCRCIKYIVIRCAKFIKARSIKTSLALCFLFILYLHFRVIPRATHTYNDSCYLSSKELEDMTFLLTRVTDAFNKENATYWLDFGTLLGVWKTGAILRYDGDIDLGRLYSTAYEDAKLIGQVQSRLQAYNITISAYQAKYNGKTADLFRWKIHDKVKNSKINTTSSKVLRKWYPFTETFGLVGDAVNYIMPPEVPFDSLFPLKTLSVYGSFMKIPNRPLDIIKIRYPMSWIISFPYKWKCWLT